MFSYRSLLKQAWNISWKHKYLWFLGLFASLTAAGGSWEYQLVSQNINQGVINGTYNHLGNILALATLVKNFFIGFISLFNYDFLTIVNAITLLLIVFILLSSFIWLAITCQSALVGDVKKIINSKKKNLNISLRESLSIGHNHFWSVFSINILIKLLISAILFIISLPLLLIALKDTAILATIYIVLFIIFIPITVGLSLMLKYAIAYNILDRNSLISSIEKAWKLFTKNWLVSLELAVILFIINFIIGVIVLAILAVFILPLLLLGVIFNITWLIFFNLFLAITIIVFIGSILSAFQISTWTSLFLILKNGKAAAKLERIFSK